MMANGWTTPGNRSNQHIQRWNNWLYPRSTAAGQTIREIIDKSRTRQAEPIPPRFRVGTKVLFRIDVDHYMKPAKRYTGRIVQSFHKNVWYYVIQTSDGTRYSLPHYKTIMQVHNELMVIEQPVVAIAIIEKLEQPSQMAGEQAA